MYIYIYVCMEGRRLCLATQSAWLSSSMFRVAGFRFHHLGFSLLFGPHYLDCRLRVSDFVLRRHPFCCHYLDRNTNLKPATRNLENEIRFAFRFVVIIYTLCCCHQCRKMQACYTLCCHHLRFAFQGLGPASERRGTT